MSKIEATATKIIENRHQTTKADYKAASEKQ